MRRGLTQDLQRKARTLLRDADGVAKRLAQVLDETNREHVASALERLHEASGRLVAMQDAAMPAAAL